MASSRSSGSDTSMVSQKNGHRLSADDRTSELSSPITSPSPCPVTPREREWLERTSPVDSATHQAALIDWRAAPKPDQSWYREGNRRRRRHQRKKAAAKNNAMKAMKPKAKAKAHMRKRPAAASGGSALDHLLKRIRKGNRS